MTVGDPEADDTAVGGLDETDIGTPVDETDTQEPADPGTDPGTDPAPATDPDAGLDDSAAGGLDETDLGAPVDETDTPAPADPGTDPLPLRIHPLTPTPGLTTRPSAVSTRPISVHRWMGPTPRRLTTPRRRRPRP